MSLNNQRPTIAVTGSAGKTTTKSMIASILRQKWFIYESKDVNNAFINTEKNAKRIRKSHQAVVVEFGMAYYGHIVKHCSFITPNIGVITNIGTAHIGNFKGDITKLASAKSELIQHMDQNGVLLINSDDVNSKHLPTHTFPGTIIKIGINTPGHYRAENVEYSEEGMNFTVNLRGRSIPFYIPIFGVHNVYNALFAIAVADRLGFSHEEISTGLKEYKKPRMRMVTRKLNGDITLIDDSFSANLNAMKAAIDVLVNVGGEGTKVAVLGDMKGLGVITKKAHLEVGSYGAMKKVDILYTIGKYSQLASQAALDQGIPLENVIHFEDKETLYQNLSNLSPGTTILVKGSRTARMEDVVNYLINQYGML
ncbi:UDP-N-acetylmuramoyl-tripeptide--D-alanyl-D-alanine ligase [Neobacillus niacini]|jgi:UDP-N-acetylmuramoyl-tripeptide--D-alanyl-D-alanine ligase|uniref:UDP-N-acetylmuramoyl-tripeptide--D-alanyl-D- alanine ligase n=1 Tax=Neobacillus niacini TaxID=86668 RepID=UPI001C8ED5B0|nr:UDP-N-acetylmuramoyl-tripeptide--D-alanyl-D-alanine ligase [Neobacillus niacini]MBY0148960.1 UDP-N-acetylmuramoyl-tripeptide--D-alanyl-D-alanine ligase [Neobacillus niacini]